MKLYKQIDLIIQVTLLVLCVIISFDKTWFVLYSYCIFGGWQLLSVFIHFILREKYYPANGRNNYLFTVIIIFASALLLYLTLRLHIPSEIYIIYLFLLLLITPVVGIWYIFICNAEIQTLKYKALVHLK